MHLRRSALSAAFVFVVALGVLNPSPAGATGTLPVHYSSARALAVAALHPGADPPGANDWGCRPSAAHPRPVVLVHATFVNMTVNWNAASPLLKNNGYCVFAFDYGSTVLPSVGAIGDMEASAGVLAAFVARVLGATGAAKVDLVGHSQGGMMPRWYLKFLGGGAKVGTLVGLSPSNHGTGFYGAAALARLLPGVTDVLAAGPCQACIQQLRGSEFNRRLDEGGDTVPGVNYTVIQTRYDQVVTPYSAAFLHGPAVTNILLQDTCWSDFSEHLAVAFDHVALGHMLNALDPPRATRPWCSYVAPVTGG